MWWSSMRCSSFSLLRQSTEYTYIHLHISTEIYVHNIISTELKFPILRSYSNVLKKIVIYESVCLLFSWLIFGYFLWIPSQNAKRVCVISYWGSSATNWIDISRICSESRFLSICISACPEICPVFHESVDNKWMLKEIEPESNIQRNRVRPNHQLWILWVAGIEPKTKKNQHFMNVLK